MKATTTATHSTQPSMWPMTGQLLCDCADSRAAHTHNPFAHIVRIYFIQLEFFVFDLHAVPQWLFLLSLSSSNPHSHSRHVLYVIWFIICVHFFELIPLLVVVVSVHPGTSQESSDQNKTEKKYAAEPNATVHFYGFRLNGWCMERPASRQLQHFVDS